LLQFIATDLIFVEKRAILMARFSIGMGIAIHTSISSVSVFVQGMSTIADRIKKIVSNLDLILVSKF
jgi:hypothetical protein